MKLRRGAIRALPSARLSRCVRRVNIKPGRGTIRA